jgi:hypothetical protein
MKTFFFVVILALTSIVSSVALAARKAKIINPSADVYSDADFDSDILDTVQMGQDYYVSDKVYGPFYRIKLKSGKIGYIPDTDVDVEGKGRVNPGGDDTDDPFLKDMDDEKETPKKSKKHKKEEDEEEDDQVLHGITVQLINYHEDTLGSVQYDDLPAIGYKYLGDLTWEVIGSFKTPKYYTEKLNASAHAMNFWGSFGLTNEIPLMNKFSARYGGGLMTHASFVKVETTQKTYDMEDLTVGGYLEGSFMLRVAKLRYDLAIKYVIDKQAYGGLAFTVFF